MDTWCWKSISDDTRGGGLHRRVSWPLANCYSIEPDSGHVCHALNIKRWLQFASFFTPFNTATEGNRPTDCFSSHSRRELPHAAHSPASVGRWLPGLRPRAARSAFGVLVAVHVWHTGRLNRKKFRVQLSRNKVPANLQLYARVSTASHSQHDGRRV